MHAADTPLVVAELPTASGCVLGTLTLNVESSLNSLTLEMIRAMIFLEERGRENADFIDKEKLKREI